MNTDKSMLLENAHLLIMAVSLIVAIVGWSAYLSPAPSKASRDVFCYMPTGVQPSLTIDNGLQPAVDQASKVA